MKRSSGPRLRGALLFLALTFTVVPGAARSAGSPAAAASSSPSGADLLPALSMPPAMLTPTLLNLPIFLARRTFSDTTYIASAPSRWDRRDWLGASLITGLAGSAFTLDSSVDRLSREGSPRSGTEGRIEDVLQQFGGPVGVIGVVGASYLYGILSPNPSSLLLASDLSESLLVVGGGVTGGLKKLTGRSRPREGLGPFDFAPFSGNASFPSGHTASAFTIASVLSRHLGDSLWASVPLYTLATGVAFSRVRANAHFLSDVGASALLGTIVGRTVARPARETTVDRQGVTDLRQPPPRISVLPHFERGGGGLVFDIRF